MITIVCMYWTRNRRRWQSYAAHHVNVLRSMFKRHLSLPHAFVCATDAQVRGDLEDGIRVVPLWQPAIALGNAYPKLELFAPYAGDKYGERILYCDLDTVLAGSVDHLVDRPEDIVLLPEFKAPIPAARRCHYNSSLILLRAGTHSDVWQRFDLKRSPREVRSSGKVGSDQVWVSHVLGPGMPTWSPAESGILSFKYDVMGIRSRGGPLKSADEPPGAAVISFHGQYKPWDAHVQRACPWIARHYR